MQNVRKFFQTVKGSSAMITEIQFHDMRRNGGRIERVSFLFRMNPNEPKSCSIMDQLGKLAYPHVWEGCHVDEVSYNNYDATLRVDGLTQEIKEKINEIATKIINRGQLMPDLKNVIGKENGLPVKRKPVELSIA
jgi:hypothetical protein